MTEDRFIDLVTAYGADPMRWPLSERAEASALAAGNSPRIQAALREAAALDDQLSQATVPPVSAALLDRLHRSARPGLVIRLKAILGWDGSLWQPAAALTAALVLGIGLGVANPQEAAAVSNILGETTDNTALEFLLEDGEAL